MIPTWHLVLMVVSKQVLKHPLVGASVLKTMEPQIIGWAILCCVLLEARVILSYELYK